MEQAKAATTKAGSSSGAGSSGTGSSGAGSRGARITEEAEKRIATWLMLTRLTIMGSMRVGENLHRSVLASLQAPTYITGFRFPEH